MYTLSWFILCAILLIAAFGYTGYILQHRKDKKRGFDVRHGKETGYHGPKEQPGSYF